MVRNLVLLAAVWIAIAAATGCTAATNAEQQADAEPDACGDCVQPPLRRTELTEHLQEHQERILARDDYRYQLPPSISETIYGPLPNEQLRAGPEITDGGGETRYDGELHWHHIGFDDVDTDGIDERALRGRDVSGAHCFFAKKPNKKTAIFSWLVVHGPRGDAVYIGGPHHPVERADVGPWTRRPTRIQPDHLWCAFRGDQNRMGALIVPYQYAGDEHTRYALLTVITGGERRPTGDTTVVERSARSRTEETVQERVPVKKYPEPRVEYRDSFDTVYAALTTAEEVIPPGRFRLWPSFLYPEMAHQPYLHGERRQFCPARVECVEERQHFDVDIVPPLPVPDGDGESDADSNAE